MSCNSCLHARASDPAAFTLASQTGAGSTCRVVHWIAADCQPRGRATSAQPLCDLQQQIDHLLVTRKTVGRICIPWRSWTVGGEGRRQSREASAQFPAACQATLRDNLQQRSRRSSLQGCAKSAFFSSPYDGPVAGTGLRQLAGSDTLGPCQFRSNRRTRTCRKRCQSGSKTHTSTCGAPVVCTLQREDAAVEKTLSSKEVLASGFHPPSSGHLAFTRMLYSLVMYGGMVVVSKVISDTAGVDLLSTFTPDAHHFFRAVLFSLPPIFVTLVLRQDSVVASWRPARVVRQVEDDEVKDFYRGMSLWQYSLVSTVGAMSEELFFRATVHGGIVHALHWKHMSHLSETSRGVSVLTESIHAFAPCAHALALLVTACITGSMFYLMASPRGLAESSRAVIVTSVQDRAQLRHTVAVWKEEQQLRQVYPPLAESLLSAYLSLEWVMTGNLLAPMVTHALFSYVSLWAAMKRGERRLDSTS